jgi:hypothetical protein
MLQYFTCNRPRLIAGMTFLCNIHRRLLVSHRTNPAITITPLCIIFSVNDIQFVDILVRMRIITLTYGSELLA